MVSARVLNPVLSEFCKMSASPGVTRNLHYGRQLERIKRNLFGPAPTNLMETKTPFNAELERHQEMATQKWGFDFRSDRPLSANGSFIWERVSSQESTFAPQMYTLTRAAHVRSDANDSAMASDMDTLLNERADRENLANSSLDSNTDNEYDSQNESMPLAASTSAAALTASTSSCNYSTQQRKRQLKITEFMKERKRLPQAPKKISPAKRMRTSSGSSSHSHSASSSSRSSSSLGAQFGCLLKRSRNDN
ncbi:uncharacterized protein LOC117784952 isoform X2 [Drosophila innubila]|uniref:uncharacterized protein LOC117784952 isoform X2 n=1 Tax=Drosophila innubila TaxID=198719 RepID=UPI00148D310F|nr:uncharacterized protein LOC117784952 isoform X2 [Drosophila innubila]